MLTCVFHPIDSMRVVDEEEAGRLRASGVWFDSPADAQAYRAQVEKNIRKEKAAKATKKPKEELREKQE